MSTRRMQAFQALQFHPWLGRVFARLSDAEIQIAENFIRENDGLDGNDFEIKLNRMFLDRERPRNFTIILELLSNANCRR